MNNRIRLMLSVILSLCILTSCNNLHHEKITTEPSNDDFSAPIVVGNLANYTPIILTDEIIVYSYFLDNATLAIGKYDMDSKKEISIGTKDNFSISYGIPILIGNIAYLPITLENGEHNLLSIDIKNNSIENVFINYNSEPLDSISTMSDQIYILSSNLNENGIYSSYINKYNATTRELSICVLKESNNKNNGELIKAVACNDNKIYALTEKKDNSSNDIYIDVYDNEEYSHLNTLYFDDEVKPYILNNNIAQFYSFADYFYIRDYSDYGFIGKIEDNSIKSILRLPQLRIAHNSKNTKDEYYAFFIREGNEFYLLDVENDSLLKSNLQLSEAESIRNAITDSNNLCISILDESIEDSYVTKETIICSYKYLLGYSKKYTP